MGTFGPLINQPIRMKIYSLIAALAISSLVTAQTDSTYWITTPAISPDGKTIAFSYQGDIFTVPYEGGVARQLTLHEAYEVSPVWSADGKKIAFSSMRHGNADVFIVDLAGGTPARLTFHSAGDTPFDFTPDGTEVIYGSSRMDHHKAVLFPSGVLPELYKVPVSGGREMQILTTPAESARMSPDGSRLIFEDVKGYESPQRKHHTSSVARDIWMYSFADSAYHQLISDTAEDRNPVWAAGENKFFFLSERSGSFNIWKADITQNKAGNFRQVSQFEDHPVRSITLSGEGMLCYSFNGGVYTQLDGQPHRMVPIEVNTDRRYNESVIKMITDKAEQFALSPNGKEIAFIVRGEVFVTSVEFSTTKRITNTPEQERDLDFNHDGTKLLYSGERNGSWNIYEASLGRKDERYFYNATLIEEKALVETPEETFQATYSPDGKEVAFLEERTTLRIKNLAGGKVRTVLAGDLNYSYADGDQYYTWSPDSKYLLVLFNDKNRWNSQVGLLDASGEKPPVNLTESGYGNNMPKFAMGGEAIIWATDRDGYRSHGSWGAQQDIYALFLTKEAHRKFKLKKSDYALWKEAEEEREKKDGEKDGTDEKKKKEDDKKDEKSDKPKEVKPLVVDYDGLQDRKEKLTLFSSFLSDFVMDEKAENLYFAAQTDDGTNLWKTEFKDSETKILTKIGDDGTELYFDKDEKFLFVNKSGSLAKIKVEDGTQEAIAFSSEMNLNTDAERAYMYEHVWRQFKKKFYLEDLHGVDWNMYKANYARFLPHINNGYDFADMLSEMLGEVNASHTGAYYGSGEPTDDRTAGLGVFFDQTHTGDGLRIAEVMDKSPLKNPEGKVLDGVIIEKIDGTPIKAGENFWPLLNRKADKKVLISYHNPRNGKRWDEVVEPISAGEENELAYERWVKTREAETERLSDGKIGYVHVRGMDSESFREVFSKALGKHNDKDALVVDTRFNGGGWLHDDLATFLSGEPYMQFEPRGQTNMGGEPIFKWQKPSAVIMGESNYSDAHMFPYTYKFFDIGKLIGMPVPGTGTAVWWEQMMDGTVFGIPQVGMRDVKTGALLENTQLEPDIRVMNEPAKVRSGSDEQLEATVKHLLGE